MFQVRIKMTKYKSSFQDEWLVNENYSCWVKKTNDKHKAYCTICLKEFSVLGQGIKALDVYAEGKGHKEKLKQTDNQSKLTFVAKNSEETLEKTVRPKQQEKIDTMMIKTATLKAEIIWSSEVLMSNYSFNSCANKSDLFAVVFEDSQIAQSFSLGSTKLSYNITFGLAPHVKNLLLESVDEVKCYSLLFDESYNRITKKGQMSLLIRFWDRVQTRYLDSSFLGKTSANDIYDKFTSAAKVLNLTRFLQVSSDGPNVNLAFFNIVNDKRKEMEFSHSIHRDLWASYTPQCFFSWC